MVTTALDRTAVVDAACRLARRDGLDAVGIRAVAGEAGVTPMALYRHIADAADLRNAVLTRLCESLPAAPGSADGIALWAHAFRACAPSFHTVYRPRVKAISHGPPR